MAEYRNITDSEMWVPLANTAVEPGATFELPDDVARDHAFSEEIFETVIAPEPLPEPKAPKKNASHEAWRDYALSQGADPTRIADMSRDDLIAEFGDKED